MHLGRHQLGSWLEVYLQVTDANGAPAMPDLPPTIKVRRSSDEALIVNLLMPVLDKSVQVGLFCAHLFLGTSFATGQHTIELLYKCSTKQEIETRTFDVIGGGDVRGTVLAMYYYHRPARDFIVYQAESGLLLKGANPRLA